jgi:hypothetical protein
MSRAKAWVALTTVLVLIFVLALIAASTVLAHPKNGSYKGSTSQSGGDVSFRVAHRGKAVKGFQGIMNAKCTKGSAEQSIDGIVLEPNPDMAIRRNAFRFHGVFNLNSGSVVIAHNVDGNLAGEFTSKTKAKGTLNFKWKFDSHAPPSFRGYACKTGRVTYSASRS